MQFPLRAYKTRLVLRVMLTLVFVFATAFAHAKDYKSIVVFGDSLSDTGNVAHLTMDKYGVRIPGPAADYTDGRFTDGLDTIPAAENFSGVWIEQFAATIPSQPEVRNSLDGGTNYAYGFAFTGNGTGTLDLTSTISVQVKNIGQQITDYLATNPKIDDSTLFVVWGGANDLINATSESDILNAAVQETLDIQRLINAGATQFIVPNLPPLGLTPRLNGSPTSSVPATEAAEVYNSYLAAGIQLLREEYPHGNMTIFQLDVFALFNQIVASPASFSLANITQSSQGNYLVNPDTYLFWDGIHPTTRGHNLLALAAETLVAQHQCNSKGGAACVYPSK